MMRPHLLAVLWTLLILAGCSIPGSELPRLRLLSADKVAHVTLFAVFGWLWMRTLPHRLRLRAIYVLTGGIAYGLFTEVYQGLMPLGRSFDPYDALADATGVLLGIGGYVLWHRYRGRRSEPARG